MRREHVGPWVSYHKGDSVTITRPKMQGVWGATSNADRAGQVCLACGTWLKYPHYSGGLMGCMRRCFHCEMLEEDHPVGNCLFHPTKFLLLEYQVKVRVPTDEGFSDVC